VGRNTFNSSL